MRESRGLSFLESMAVSALTGAGTGAIRGATGMPEEIGDELTRNLVDIALETGNRLKRRDRDGYIPGLKY